MYHMCPPIYAKGHPLHYTRTENSTIGVRIKIHSWWQRDGLKGTRLRVACLVLCPYWLAYATAATLVVALEGDEASWTPTLTLVALEGPRRGPLSNWAHCSPVDSFFKADRQEPFWI